MQVWEVAFLTMQADSDNFIAMRYPFERFFKATLFLNCLFISKVGT